MHKIPMGIHFLIPGDLRERWRWAIRSCTDVLRKRWRWAIRRTIVGSQQDGPGGCGAGGVEREVEAGGAELDSMRQLQVLLLLVQPSAAHHDQSGAVPAAALLQDRVVGQ